MRAGFGGTPEEIEAVRKNGLSAAVHQLVDETGDAAVTPPPTWAQPRNLQEIRRQIRAAKEQPGEPMEKRREFREMEI